MYIFGIQFKCESFSSWCGAKVLGLSLIALLTSAYQANMVFKSTDNCSHEFLDAGQYQKNGILRYERIFGETFVSTGGEATTKVKATIFILRHVLGK